MTEQLQNILGIFVLAISFVMAFGVGHWMAQMINRKSKGEWVDTFDFYASVILMMVIIAMASILLIWIWSVEP